MSNSKTEILVSALALVRDGRPISLESTAREVGLTKPGLMYHFPTKDALMLALVHSVADDWTRGMTSRLSAPLGEASSRERVGVYLEECLARSSDPADMVMLSDPRLRHVLLDAWVERLAHWFEGIDALPARERGVLSAVRLMADGIWFAKASGMNPPSPDEEGTIRATAYDLLESVPA